MKVLSLRPLSRLLLLAFTIVTLVEGSPLSERNTIETESTVLKLVARTHPSKLSEGVLLPREQMDEELKALEVVNEGFSLGSECDIKLTNFPAKLFSGEDPDLRQQFCTNWNKDGEKYSLVVEYASRDKSKLKKRTPPVMSAYGEWKIHLSYRPHNNDQDCTYDCNGIFEQFAISCSGSSSGQLMYETGTYDVGCGKFWYKIEEPSKIRSLYDVEMICSSEDEYDPKEPVPQGGLTMSREEVIHSGAEAVCRGGDDGKGLWIKKGDISTSIHQPHHSCLFTPFRYRVYWKDGCELEEGWDWVYINDPQDKRESYDKICAENLVRTWKECNNGGRGGELEVGCLVYQFRADLETEDCHEYMRGLKQSG